MSGSRWTTIYRRRRHRDADLHLLLLCNRRLRATSSDLNRRQEDVFRSDLVRGRSVCRRSVLNWGFLMSSNGFVIMEGTVVSGTLMLKTEIIVHNDQVLMNMWGAGTLYDNKGHIVTNAHVVSAYIKVPGEGAPRWLFGKVLANFEGGEECEAEVLSVDVGNDVALLKIPERVIKSDNIPCVLSKDVPGRRAKFFVVGHPNDIPFVVLYGRVSRPSRPLSDFENIPKGDFFNHMDPAMEFLELGGVMAAPGLSGGPLSTEEGSVFGVLNAGIQGIAYGIPAAIIESALDRMFKRSQLGGGVFCHLN